MSNPRHNLLTDPLIQVRLPDEARSVSLPEVLSLLSRNQIQAFTHLRPHQTHAWHAFLVQLGAIALHQGGYASAPTNPDEWKNLFLSLTNGEQEPWCLLVGDLSKPAFLQPPVPEGSLDGFKNRMGTPDDLDILITAKNHDIKAIRMVAPSPDHWLYAILTLQTMQGFLGAGNYGIARMNGGFSSRPCVSLTPGLSLGARFLRDLSVLLESRDALVASHDFSKQGGIALLWLLPWDGTEALAWNSCDPYFIEICRRIRLKEDAQKILALAAPSKTRRIQADERKGDTGDPWTPVLKSDGKGLTVPSAGFSYRLAQELMFGGDYIPGITQKVLKTEDGADFYAWALVRGQGITEGLHERRIPLPPKVRGHLGRTEERLTLAELAKRRVEAAAKIQKQVLKPALCALLQGGPEKIDFSDERPKAWLQALDDDIDRVFFDSIWEDLELSRPEADRKWEQLLVDLANRRLEEAIHSLPHSSARYHRAIAVADRVFFGCTKKHFPEWSPSPVQGEIKA